MDCRFFVNPPALGDAAAAGEEEASALPSPQAQHEPRIEHISGEQRPFINDGPGLDTAVQAIITFRGEVLRLQGLDMKREAKLGYCGHGEAKNGGRWVHSKPKRLLAPSDFKSAPDACQVHLP